MTSIASGEPSLIGWRRAVTALGTPKWFSVFLAIWVAITLFGGVPHGDLSGYDDATYAHEARAMLQSGDLWTPNLNGGPDFDKPPLFIWMVALSFKLFGINDTSARIPGVLLGLATIILVYFLAKELFHDKTADGLDNWIPAIAMLSMATTQYFLKYAGHVMTDVPFTFLFTAAIYFYTKADKKKLLLLLSGVAAGLAMLMRSPMGLFPMIVILVDIGHKRQFRHEYLNHFLAASAIAVATPTVWYLHEYSVYGQEFVTRHIANIFAHSGGEIDKSGLQRFISYFEYLFMIAQLYLPWFPLTLFGVYLAFKKAVREAVPVESLLFVWIIIAVVPFSAADAKSLRYILPAFPAFAILSAVGLERLLKTRSIPGLARLSALILAITAVFLVAVPNYRVRAEEMRIIAPVTDAATAPDERVLIYTQGEFQWNYLNQLLWYGHRYCIHAKDLQTIDHILHERGHIVVVIDKSSSHLLIDRNDVECDVLGESGSFVCLRIVRG